MASGKSQYLILIVILGIVVFNLYNMRQIQTDVDGFNQKIDVLNQEIDSVQQLNTALDATIQSLHTELQMIDGDINKVQNNIYTIRKNTDEKINTVNTLTAFELQEFFTKRYDSIIKRYHSTPESTNSETRY